MEMVTTIGLDIAKSVFQAHGVDAGRCPTKTLIPGPDYIELDERWQPTAVVVSTCNGPRRL
jgi:hypothetical protein